MSVNPFLCSHVPSSPLAFRPHLSTSLKFKGYKTSEKFMEVYQSCVRYSLSFLSSGCLNWISGQMSSRWPRTEIFPKLYQMFNAARPTALSHSDPGLHCLEVVKLQTQVSKFGDESELNLKLSFYHYNKLSNSIMSNYDWIKFPNQVYLKCIYVYVGCIIFIIFHPSLFLLNLKTLRTHLDLMWFKLVISFGSEKCRAFYQNIYCNRLLL